MDKEGITIMWQFVVLYRRPDDPEAFERYYREVHLPLVWKFPGLRRVTLSKVEADQDGSDAGVFLISTMYWADRASLELALRSPARKEAYEDSGKFRHLQLGRYIGSVEDVCL